MKNLFSIGLLIVLFSITTFAQLSTSNLVGTVSGPDGVLPGATVTVRDNKTDKELTATTGDDGGFRFSNLEIGFYTVSVTATGFKSFTANEVRLEIGKDYSLPVPLEVGGVSETVVVTAGTDIVNSTDAQQNGIISNRQIEQLPLLTRDPLGFVPLQAGVASNPSQPSTINGIRTSGTNITIEGVNVQDNYIRSNATDFSPARPLVDEVEEFTVTGQANVDRGFGAGQIQFPIRRGGNRYNGSIYDYNRNSDFEANDFFSNSAGVARRFRNRNDFGGRFSGPLPFLNFGEGGPVTSSGKDKLFFFVFYQKTIDIIPSNETLTTLTSNARNGLFTYIDNGDDNGDGIRDRDPRLQTVNLFNPALGTGITSINPFIASQILAGLPSGNSTQAGDQRVTTGFQFNQNTNSEQTNYATRIDYTINDRHALKGIFRYVYQTLARSDQDNTFSTISQVNQPSSNPFFSVGLVSTFTDNFTNEIQGGFSFSDPTFVRDQDPTSPFVAPTLVTNPVLTFQNQGRVSKAYNIQDNASYQAGNHSIRFGAQFQAIRVNAFNNAGINPTFTLGVNTNTPQILASQFLNPALFPGTVPADQRATANSLLALLGGIVSSSTQTFNVTSQGSGFVNGASNARRFESEIYGLYASDQWRIRPDLTINAGLRYDIYTGLRNPEGLFLEPVIADGQDPVATILNPNGRYQFVGGNSGTAGQFFKTDFNNFGPNVSFAYAPSFERGFGKYLLGENRTIIRGGYRISYINDEFIASANNAGIGNAGLSTTLTSANLNIRANALPVIAAPVFTPTRTFADNNTGAFNFFGTVFAIDPEIQTPMVQEYSLGVQRELGFNTALEIRYVGSRSTNLIRAIDLNQLNINSNGFLADFNRARSNLQINQAERARRINALVAGGQTQAMATATINAQLPESGAFNSTLTGSQVLTVFPNLASGGLLTNGTITGQLTAGTPADLALIYIQNGLQGSVQFRPNPNTGVADLLGNAGNFNYNSLQVEVRRRFSDGFQLQANYTFSKNLTNSSGSQSNDSNQAQNRFDPQLDNGNPDLEYGRATFDQTHKFNLNAVYELPFGRGKAFFSEGGVANALLGGFAVSGILQIGSGAPISFNDIRGTLNRAGRSGRQTALTNLSKEQLKDLVGVFRTDNGVFFINPTALGRDSKTGLLLPGRDGRGVSGNFDAAPFQGQVFFRNAPGQTSGLERAIVNGPTFYTLDMSLIKRFSFGERYSFQIQGDAFNILNTTNFAPAQSQDINSVNFGRITSAFDPRILQLSARFNF